jgi:hypothetical protein
MTHEDYPNIFNNGPNIHAIREYIDTFLKAKPGNGSITLQIEALPETDSDLDN